MIIKNEEYIVEIIDNGIDGEGIAKIDGYTVFVDGAIKGETIKVLIVKVNKTYGFGKIIEIITPSKDREEPICPVYKTCGGCNLQHISYEGQLRLKEEKVKKTLEKFGISASINSIIGMGIPYNYRNKAQYPCQNGSIGFYSKRSHRIVKNDYCYIQDEEADRLAKRAFELLMEEKNECYDEEKNAGNIRHIMVRVGKNSYELMLVIVTKNNEIKGITTIIEKLKVEFTNLKSIVQNINDKSTNIIMGKECKTLFGEGYIVDKLGDYNFKISPLSFYQVNPVQTEALYNTAIEMTNLNGKETVFDLYCGIGTISTFLSSKCKKVYGVEIVPEAIEDAKENAKLNSITNIDYRCGAAEELIPKIYKEGINADVVFVDPPRKGCDKVLLDTIIEMKPEKMVYISCNVATLGRDLEYLLQNGFELREVQPVDQFPQTAHVESIAVLERR